MTGANRVQESGPTGDPGVDALVALAAQAAQLPAGEHRKRYTEVLAGLERELDADPGAVMRDAAPVPHPVQRPVPQLATPPARGSDP